MKSLVIFYSFEGNTRLMAKVISEELGADILDLKPKNEITRNRIFKYVHGASRVLRHKEPELEDFDIKVDSYDLLVFGGPVWAGTYAPPLLTYFTNYPTRGKSVAFFCCHGGKPGSALDDMIRDCGDDNEVIDVADFFQPLQNNPEEKKEEAKAWARALIEKQI